MYRDTLLDKVRESIGDQVPYNSISGDHNFDDQADSMLVSVKNFVDLKTLFAEVFSDKTQNQISNFKEDDFNPDTLAYYRSFRNSLTSPVVLWGIFFRLDNCKRFIRMIAQETSMSINEVISPALTFILEHEINHFNCDLSCLMIMLNRRSSINSVPKRKACWHEESLGQTRAWKKLEKNSHLKTVADYIRSYYESTSLLGYNDFELYKNQIDKGFDQVIEHNLQGDCQNRGSATLAHLSMNQREYPPSKIPLYVEFGPNHSHAMHLRTVTGIRWSNRASKKLERISKGDRRLEKEIRATLETFKRNPHDPSLKTEKYKSAKGDWSIHINQGERLLLSQDDSGIVFIKDLGNKIYKHGT